MTDEVNQSPESPMEDPSIPEVNPLVAIHPSVEKETNIMTPEEMNLLRESYFFPLGVQIRIPEEKETSFNPLERGGLLRGRLSCGPPIFHSSYN